jgi:hypothetical protein
MLSLIMVDDPIGSSRYCILVDQYQQLKFMVMFEGNEEHWRI